MGSGRLKPGWTRVAFGDMATCVNERIDDPTKAGVERYVGLEHLDSDSLTIRRWGSPTDVTATKLRFRKGDIIFGRRRVYQRKLAVADFDGICSAHAMVLRAKSQAILPEFLPFFMQSDIFMNRAKMISVGSLSPTINWRTLEQEEFALPPLEEQQRIARAMSSMDSVLFALAHVRYATDNALLSVYDTIFSSTTKCSRFLLSDVADVRMGRQRAPQYSRGNYIVPYLRAANIVDGQLDLTSVHEMNFNPSEQEIFGLRPGDILISEGCGSRARIGDNAVWQNEIAGTVCFQNTVIRLRAIIDRISPELLRHWVRHAFSSGLFSEAARGTGIFHIGQKRCEQLPVQLPAASADRDSATRLVLTVENAGAAIRNRILETTAARNQVEVLSGIE